MRVGLVKVGRVGALGRRDQICRGEKRSLMLIKSGFDAPPEMEFTLIPRRVVRYNSAPAAEGCAEARSQVPG